MIEFVFPSGGGGHWLLSLIHGLESQEWTISKELPLNYHTYTQTRNAKVAHYSNNLHGVYYFNGTCAFNIYLNIIKKYLVPDEKIFEQPCPLIYDRLACDAEDKILFSQKTIDLNYNYLYTDVDQFIQTLYNILSENHLDFTQNTEYCKHRIEQFKRTCVDTELHFDNWDSEYWLGWCNGINKYHNGTVLLYNTQEEIRQALLPNRDFFCSFTLDKIVK